MKLFVVAYRTSRGMSVISTRRLSGSTATSRSYSAKLLTTRRMRRRARDEEEDDEQRSFSSRNRRSNLRHEVVHVLHHAFRVVIVEVEPEHRAGRRDRSARASALAIIVRIADERVVGRAAYLLFVERPFQRAPVVRQARRAPLPLPARGSSLMKTSTVRGISRRVPAAAVGVICRCASARSSSRSRRPA